MSRLRQSIRRRLHRRDSPPVPVGRSLARASARGSTHLPSIPEAGAELVTVWPLEAAAGAAAAPAHPAAEPAAVAPSAAAAPEPSAAAAASTTAAAQLGASFEEVDLSEPRPAAAPRAPPRRFASLSCAALACFAAPAPLR